MTKNNPFRKAKRELNQCAQETANRAAQKNNKKNIASNTTNHASITPQNDSSLFHEAISGTRPLKNTDTIPPIQCNKNIRVHRHLQEESLTYALSDFAGEVTSSHSNETLSYRGNGIQQRLFKKLRHGQIPIENRLDMHGLTVEPAREILSQFITESLTQQFLCVIIVHGKGSRGGLPVLKTMLNHWLKQIPDVLAYHSAQPRDGGTGALYVLLKNKQKLNA